MSKNSNRNIVSVESPVSTIFSEEEFSQLDKKEKEYTYHLFKASWEGSKICYFQRSWESPALFYIFQQIFNEDLETLKESSLKKGITEAEFSKIIVYSCAFFQNCGNYLSFGDTKFIPEISEEKFYEFICSAKCFSFPQIRIKIDELWKKIKKFVYNYDGIYSSLGLKPDGLSGFYAHEITKEEVDLIDEFLQVMKISPLNTRIGKINNKEYTLHIASVNSKKKNTHFYKDIKVHIIYGDFSPFIRRITKSLEKAYEFSANKLQKKMIDLYLEHFYDGDIEVHKESQRYWVKDISPIIETNIGFVETYMDPMGVRAEFESWVAVVNKEQSIRTTNLVNKADDLLNLFSPWPKEFEKDKFLKPDFTSLSVVAFGCSGTPLGINIPNYDEIVQEVGFKNVYLANNTVSYKELNFIEKSLAENLIKHSKNNMFFIVAYHELLGHGCGKLFSENSAGEKNFNENLINPFTNKKIETWYKSEETWSTLFGKLSNPYEECRADSVALYYSCFEESYDILLPECKSFWQEISLACFTEFVFSGLKALEFYNEETKLFTQAHMNAGYVILKVLIEAGNNFIDIKLTESENKNGEKIDWIYINIDKNQILSTGKRAMGDFLFKMNVFKATADLERASEMYYKYSEVDEFFLKLRKIIVDNKKPRRIEIQGNLLREKDGSITFKKYKDDFYGIIESFKDRFSYIDEEILNEWENMQDYFKPMDI
jgi:dipeptidyl-peptidase-3